jgi:two-component system, NtrC family, sensor kinase
MMYRLGAMAVPILRSISGRIILGFTVLILTFAGVTTYSAVNMSRLTVYLRLLRAAYLPLAFKAKELQEKQDNLRDYLKYIRSESSQDRVRDRLRGYRATRRWYLREALRITSELTNVPRGHRKAVAETRRYLNEFREMAANQEGLYEALAAAPPLDVAPPSDPVAAARAVRALEKLQANEGTLYRRLYQFREWQEYIVFETALQLEENETYIQQLTMTLGGIAVFLGLLVTGWATVTLRPLRRLQAAARRIAAGDYASRIDERGPVEVADLAREFNVMGQAIESRERELVRSERLAAVGKMAAMITHEVRNPLSSIGLNAELLEEELAELGGDSRDELRALCRSIQTEVDRLTAITEEYLKFARLPKPRTHPHDINAIVEGLADFEREQMAQRGVTLELHLAGALPRVEVDDQQIRQALLNLLRNAAEAAGESDQAPAVSITTRLAPSGAGVCIEVQDNGPGLDRDTIAKIFDPFFSTKEGGTGLGLALTLQIVRDHGGGIEVDSSPGAGARFIVTL